ncbi:MAG: GntR family transcriptional regulator [Pseudonocardia sp.]|nr:GntR family transcriptional regulator [Pseudonocardia sp.]
MAPRGTFRQIADQLRDLIREGVLKPGAMVPSELALVEQHGVARGTVRSALALLVDEGLIEVVPGQGRRIVGEPTDGEASTAYERIAADLARRVRAEEFGPNDLLPSEAALVAEYGVSRGTVRRAYRELADEGLVVIRHGSGAFAAPS